MDECRFVEISLIALCALLLFGIVARILNVKVVRTIDKGLFRTSAPVSAMYVCASC